MKKVRVLLVSICITLGVFSIMSCSKGDLTNSADSFGIFRVLSDSTTVEMNGEIGSSSLNDFNRLEARFPNINKIQIVTCDGSSDDAVNLRLSLKIHQRKLSVHIMDDGLIASGGVDFFLAGIQRTKGANTKIGVHSWSDGRSVQATDFPVGHANHLLYINYYQSIGFTKQQAEAFYYFTIHAANADNIHWMTDEEIDRYNIVTK